MMLEAIVTVTIFLVSLVLIMSEAVERTIVAVSGATVMVAAGLLLGFYSENEALEAIDFNTLGLLLGMMIVVALLEPTGFFQFIAINAGKASHGNPWLLMALLSLGTTVLSMFLNNVTTVVLIAPITILLCEILTLNPAPYLMAQAMLANTAGVATSVGDPASVLIASAGGFSFIDFLTHSLPVVAVSALVVLGLSRILFRKELGVTPSTPEAILRIDPREALQDERSITRVLVVLGGAIILFFFQGQLRISSAFIGILAGSVALAWVHPKDMREALGRVDWEVLLFFAGLFVMVGGLEKTGILASIANAITQLSLGPMWLGVVIIWVVAISSALVDNIPITIAMIGVLQGMEQAGIDVSALWWPVVFGAGFGGNGTIVGSSASMMVVNLSKKTETPITAALWTRRALPAMLASCAVTSVLFVLAFKLFGW